MSLTGVAALGAATAQGMTGPGAERQRVLRVAHLTDIHVFPGLSAPDGMAAALEHAQNQKDPPDVIFQGGDAIMDALAASKADTRTQWGLWREVLEGSLTLPIVHTIGNHDVWGWGLDDANASRDPRYGKAWALDMFGLSERFYSFDRAGWHFIVLDSNTYLEGGYTARLDEAQFEWLSGDLQETPATTPICVMSHIPIIAACVFAIDGVVAKNNFQIPGSWVHTDVDRITKLFQRHPNVRLALSGHEHMLDQVHYQGVKYLCNGAVSGGWWDGDYEGFLPVYVMIDLYDDGTSESQVVSYGWETRARSVG